MISADLVARLLTENHGLCRERSRVRGLEVKLSEKSIPLYHRIWIVSEIRRLTSVDETLSIEDLINEYVNIRESYVVDGHGMICCGSALTSPPRPPLETDECEQFLWKLRSCAPQTLFTLLSSLEDNAVISFWYAAFPTVYGSAFFTDDEHLVLDTLITMIENGCLSCGFTTLLYLYMSTNPVIRAFLSSSLRQPLMMLVSEDDWYLDNITADSNLFIKHFSETERLKRFGSPSANPVEYRTKLAAYRDAVNSKLTNTTLRFMECIERNIVTMPTTIRSLLLAFANSDSNSERDATKAFINHVIVFALNDPSAYGILSPNVRSSLESGTSTKSGVTMSHVATYNLLQVSNTLKCLFDDTNDKIDCILVNKANELSNYLTNQLNPTLLSQDALGNHGSELSRQYILISIKQLKSITTILSKSLFKLSELSNRSDQFVENMASNLSNLNQNIIDAAANNVHYMDENVAVMYFALFAPAVAANSSPLNSESVYVDGVIGQKKPSVTKHGAVLSASSTETVRSIERKLRLFNFNESDVRSLMTETVVSCYSRTGCFSTATTRSVTPLSHDYAQSEYSTGPTSLTSSAESNEDFDTGAAINTIPMNQGSESGTSNTRDNFNYPITSAAAAAGCSIMSQSSTVLLKSNMSEEVTERFNMFELHRAPASATKNNSIPDDTKSNVSENWSTIAGASECDANEQENRLCDVVEDNPIVQDLMRMHPSRKPEMAESDCWSIEPTPSETETTLSLQDDALTNEYPSSIHPDNSSTYEENMNTLSSSSTDQPICGFDLVFPRTLMETASKITAPEELKSFSTLKETLRTIFIKSDLFVFMIAQQINEESNTNHAMYESLLSLLKTQHSHNVMTGDVRTQRILKIHLRSEVFYRCKLSEAMNTISKLTSDRTAHLLASILEICRIGRALFLNSSVKQEMLLTQIQRLDDLSPVLDNHVYLSVELFLQKMVDLIIRTYTNNDQNIRLQQQLLLVKSATARCSSIQSSLAYFSSKCNKYSTLSNESAEQCANNSTIIKMHIERRVFSAVHIHLMFPEGLQSAEKDKSFISLLYRHRDQLLSRLKKCSNEALEELAALNAYKTPRDKIICLYKVMSFLSSHTLKRVAWKTQRSSTTNTNPLEPQTSLQSTSSSQPNNTPSSSSNNNRTLCLSYAIVVVNPPYFLCNLRFIRNYSTCTLIDTDHYAIRSMCKSVLSTVDNAVQLLYSYIREEGKA